MERKQLILLKIAENQNAQCLFIPCFCEAQNIWFIVEAFDFFVIV